MPRQTEGPLHPPQEGLSLLPLWAAGTSPGPGPLRSLPLRVAWADAVYCLDLSLPPSEVDRRKPAGPTLGS